MSTFLYFSQGLSFMIYAFHLGKALVCVKCDVMHGKCYPTDFFYLGPGPRRKRNGLSNLIPMGAVLVG